MKNTKKLVSMALLVSLAITSLVGCGPSTTSETKTPTKVDTSKEVALQWYFIGNGQQKDTEAVQTELNTYLKKKINATVTLNCFDFGSYDNKMKTKIAAGDKFDICFTSNWANSYTDNVARKAFVDLTDLLPTYAPKTKDLLGADFLKGSAIDGKNYAIPCNKEKAHQYGILYNSDLVKKYNLDIKSVKTIDQLEPLLKTIKDKEPGVYGLEATASDAPTQLLDWDTIGGDKLPGVLTNDSTDMKVFDQFSKPEEKTFLETIHKYYQAGYIRKDAASVTDMTADENGKKIFAMVKSLKPGKDAEMTLSSKVPWTQVEMTTPYISNRETTGSMMAISSTSDNKERALMLLELVNTDSYVNNLINFGIENKHYVKDGTSGNIIKAGPNNADYNPQIQWVFGNQFLNYLYNTEDPQKWDKFKQFNSSAKPTKTLGFTFDPSNVSTEVAAIATVWDKYNPGLQTGTSDPDTTIPKFETDLKAAGLDKVIAEKQTQLDKWAKSSK
ncbi:MAG: ABC transporter substrate-binding protein [Bacillota bacterium]|nr:ABC transporter substrate-binding protein [Bacillota bacterium]